MKNYITIAALLAAGTALANAADVSLLNVDFTGYGSWTAAQTAGWEQYKTREGDAVVNSTLGLTAASSTYGWTQTKVMHGLSSSINLAQDGVYTITYMATKGTGNTEDENNAALQFALVGNGFSIVVGSSYASNPGLYAGSIDANVLTSTEKWYSFETPTETNKTTQVQIEKGAEISSAAIVTTELTYTLTLTTSANGDDTLAISATNGTTTYSGTYTFQSDAEISAAGFMLDGYANSGQSVKNVTVIPEPSAFGLLAGLGALALVASRRRRK